jgi:hypothetical protein
MPVIVNTPTKKSKAKTPAKVLSSILNVFIGPFLLIGGLEAFGGGLASSGGFSCLRV